MIWGYAFTALNYLLYCVSRFCKKKYQMLMVDLFAKIAFVTGLVFMGSLSGAYSILANFFWLIFANVKERKGKRWPLAYLFFQILLVCIMVFQYEGISSVLVFISSTITLVSTWWLSPQQMRMTGIPVNIITLAYQLSIKNWAGLCELAVIASTLISYAKYRDQKKTQENSVVVEKADQQKISLETEQ